ncbi:MAG: S-adenosylmethionine:tRNA ribosyltransferase-isomerase [Bacteroidales bacterium]|nr:S-adenosylmethionine:tRNA ribosyltransferase-isomerase [Bacteroidales bacterium]
MVPQIRIEDYNYPLDDSRIAKYPLAERDASKLLHYKDSHVEEFSFRDLPSLLPAGAMMVFNETKVVPARMFFQRETGAHIEIFCLEPVSPPEYNTIFAATERCSWKCVVGNLKKWKNDVLSLINTADDKDIAELSLRASLVKKEGNTAVVEFTWNTGVPFSRVLDMAGKVPIPPYLNRDTEDIDLERYQTLYARVSGSVAAPTAGLHFTQRVLDGISAKGIDINKVCLHVGAGTFLPVKSSNVADHPMHREPFSVGIGLLRKLRDRKVPLIAVGTTSVRTLESLYYAGVDCIEKGAPEDIGQWVPYEREYPYSTEEVLKALVEYLESNGLEELKLGTRIIIVPGFKFRIVDYLVTNFHQPESTLILLVSAFVNGDWRRIYDFALANGFRFLSYGDSSLLERAR